MWENRCKIAVSGVGFSAGHANGGEAAGRARAGSGQGGRGGLRAEDAGHRRARDLSGIAGDRPRGGGRHLDRVRQLHDGDVEASAPHLAHPDGFGQYRRRRSAGRQRAARRRVQICGGLAGDAQSARHLPEPARHPRAGTAAVHRALRIRRPGTGHGGRLHALARKEQSESREDGDPRGDATQARAEESSRVLQGAAHARGISEFPHGRASVLPLRLRYSRAGRSRHRAHDCRSRTRLEAASRVPRGLRPAARTSRWPAASAA